MDLKIRGRTALVLGAGGGLGGAVASSLAHEGCGLGLADIDGDAARATAEALPGDSARHLAVEWDLADLDSTPDHIDAISRSLGPIDIVVNVTGGPKPSPALGQSPGLWQEQFTAMVQSVIGIADHVVPGMRERGWGRIVTSTSSGVIAPIPGLALSNALRSTLVGWSKTLASEIAADGVTVNMVVPGRVATPRIDFLDRAKAEREGRTLDDVRAASLGSIPAGRYGKPEEYGDVVAFLCSDRAAYVTGTTVRVDGGYIPSV